MKIVVGYDGSEASKKAIEKAKELVSTCKVYKISIVHVETQDALNYAPFGNALKMHDVDKARDEVFGDDLKEMQEAAKGFENSEVVTKILEGSDPAQVISDYAREEKYDLIVVGARGTGGLKKFRPGSVSKSIVDNCCTSVMVVK